MFTGGYRFQFDPSKCLMILVNEPYMTAGNAAIRKKYTWSVDSVIYFFFCTVSLGKKQGACFFSEKKKKTCGLFYWQAIISVKFKALVLNLHTRKVEPKHSIIKKQHALRCIWPAARLQYWLWRMLISKDLWTHIEIQHLLVSYLLLWRLLVNCAAGRMHALRGRAICSLIPMSGW